MFNRPTPHGIPDSPVTRLRPAGGRPAAGRRTTARVPKSGRAVPPVAAKEPRASTTDPDARVMKMADGGYRPAYNLQLASDTSTGLIAAVELDAGGSDRASSGMSDRCTCLRPAPGAASGRWRLHQARRHRAAGTGGLPDLRAAPGAARPSRDWHEALPDDPPGIAAWRRRMGSDAAQAVYRLRAATAECANAQARNRGLVRFTVRGLAKAKAAALWFALAHNMARSWSLGTI